ncbi:hypothetical protein [Anaplasma phagocytophilum]|uniref:hypothetical protein n=1 Tax=Anaplasma phagocytophilum TaxID=948 RepID=UPI00200C5719|nr:hypothetical protein [Anaplasma phagocytophilum]
MLERVNVQRNMEYLSISKGKGINDTQQRLLTILKACMFFGVFGRKDREEMHTSFGALFLIRLFVSSM